MVSLEQRCQVGWMERQNVGGLRGIWQRKGNHSFVAEWKRVNYAIRLYVLHISPLFLPAPSWNTPSNHNVCIHENKFTYPHKKNSFVDFFLVKFKVIESFFLQRVCVCREYELFVPSWKDKLYVAFSYFMVYFYSRCRRH